MNIPVPVNSCTYSMTYATAGTPFRLDTEAQVTFAAPPNFGQLVGQFALRCECDEPDIICGGRIFSRRLAPGDYYLAMARSLDVPQSGLHVIAIVDNPPPPTTNLDCGSATTINVTEQSPGHYYGSHAEPRVVEGTPNPISSNAYYRYYTFTLSTALNTKIGLFTTTPGTGVSASLRSVCDNSGSQVAAVNCGYQNGCVTESPTVLLTAGTYAIVVTALEGTNYTVSVTADLN